MTLPENIICGYFDCVKEFGTLSISPKRLVERYEIEFYLEDGYTTTTDDRTFQIKKNYIQIAKPGQIRFSKLPFKTAYLKFEAKDEIAQQLSIIPEYFHSSHPEKIHNLMDEIILLNEEQKNIFLLYSKLLAVLNLIFSDAEIPDSRSGKNYTVISNAKKFIESNFQKQITLSDISKSVHLSEIYFRSIFTESVGMSPHQFLINCRVDNAKKLLWNSDIAMSDIAEKSGFGCQQYMNKVFKKETGMTPNEYRKTFQQNYSL